MEIRSLGLRTNLFFSRFSGKVLDRGSYTLVQTPANPGFHWGNYIIFDRAPLAGDLRSWTSLFDREFPYYSEPHHYTFTWDTPVPSPGECQEFLNANYELESAVVLTATQLHPPPHPNDSIRVRKILSDTDWEQVVQLQMQCADPKFFSSYYEDFKRKQMAQYRKMSEKELGNWFGAFIDDTLVGDLGLFHETGIGRYQSVGTHPDFRRRGICGTLVHEAGKIAFDEFGVEALVMEADAEYHAARIYESVGFAQCEANYSLSWWRDKAAPAT